MKITDPWEITEVELDDLFAAAFDSPEGTLEREVQKIVDAIKARVSDTTDAVEGVTVDAKELIRRMQEVEITTQHLTHYKDDKFAYRAGRKNERFYQAAAEERARKILAEAEERVRPIVEREREGLNPGPETLDFRMKEP